MPTVGIICEYNPFHNGHIYHINKVKDLFPQSTIIAVVSGNFTQRGIPSILSKEEKQKVALENGIDLIVELPFVFATQSADIFAQGAIEILNKLKVEYLVFGSESNNIELIKMYAEEQLKNKEYDLKVKELLNLGNNYPTAMSKALNYNSLNKPNDLLGMSYVKAILKLNANITPITVQRTNDFHSTNIENISSASAIREALKNNSDIKESVPLNVYKILKQKKQIDYFNLLKYKILSENTLIKKYQTVDEGIENRILKVIKNCNSLDELIKNVKTKRYTYNKLSRMFIHILCSFTKEEAIANKNIKYIMVLGFNSKGRFHLNRIKKEIDIPIITTKKYYNSLLSIENRVDDIYKIIS